MQLLIDTQVLIEFLEGNKLFQNRIANLIADPAN